MILRRRRLWLIVLAGLVLAGGAWWLAISTSLSTRAADRIADGMSRTQVIAMIGRAPDMAFVTFERNRFDHWYVADGIIMVDYDAAGNVSKREVYSEWTVIWQLRQLITKIWP